MPDFTALYGRPPELAARAPGRVNLIGEHTDYNGGYVLPMAIPQEARVELAVRGGDLVRAASADAGAPGEILEYRLGGESRQSRWLDYVQGVTAVLGGEGLRLSGFDLFIRSEVPLGAGLSSSAALEVALLRALRRAFGLGFDDVALALFGQRAEVEFVGAPVGVMDQMAASLADDHTALFLNTADLTHRRVPLPEGAELIVINSGVAHNHAAGDYKTRRAECERAAALLGVPALGRLTPGDLPRLQALPAPLGRRARHVITEDARVLAAVEAMAAGDLFRLGSLFFASHRSMRDDYEVSVPEIDLLVELAQAEPDVYGARLTGGGFGGSIVALARRGRAAYAAARVAAAYAARSGRAPAVLVPRPGPSGGGLPDEAPAGR